jgi:AcrR family transcriptional regulator
MSTVIKANSSNQKLVQERRNQIIRCAIRLFNKRGFDGTSMRDIARACRMTSANIYNYISGKEDIIRLILEEGHLQSYQFIREAEEGLAKLSPVDALINAVALFFRHIEKSRPGVTFLYRGIASFKEDIRSSVLKVEADETAVFERIIDKGRLEEGFAVADARLLADNIISLGQMWAVKHGIFERRYTIEEYIRLQTGIILVQLGAHSGLLDG